METNKEMYDKIYNNEQVEKMMLEMKLSKEKKPSIY